MVYTEVTKNSYGSRIGNSLKGLLFGILLIVGSVILLWWNEGRTVDVATGLKEAEKITVEGNIESIDTNLEGKVVYNKGLANTDDILKDNVFLIEKNALKLDRVVEMYQWKEHVSEKREDNLGGSETVTKTYTYQKEWSRQAISSDNFKEYGHTNPSNWEYNNNEFVSNNIFLGSLKLTTGFISKLDEYKNYTLTSEDKTKFETANNKSIDLSSNYFYFGSGSLSSPKVGDLRISFKTVEPAEVSVVGLQKGDSLLPYLTSRETNVALLEYGDLTKDQLFLNAQNDNKLVAWMFRGLGLLLMFIGFKLIFNIFVILAKVIPFISRIVDFGASAISIVLTIFVGGLIIAIAWFAARPIISLIIIGVIGFMIYVIMMNKKKEEI